MTERVGANKGKQPIIVVVPHGYDDPNTAEIGERIISELDAYGVINYGWERADKFDYYKDKANCNNIHHLHEDVIDGEFLIPIYQYVKTISSNKQDACIFIIHGVSNSVANAQPTNLDLIVGWGKGNPDSLTCAEWYSNYFMQLATTGGFDVYEGGAGGNYSGRSKSNLNQLFRLWNKDPNVYSMQIEVARRLRDTKLAAQICGDRLSNAIEDIVNLRHKAFATNTIPIHQFPQI